MKFFKLKFLIFLFISSLFAQQPISLLHKAVKSFEEKNYGHALFQFDKIIGSGVDNNNLISTALYKKGECLLAMDQIDGAASVFKVYYEKFSNSNLADDALYKLGTIYFKLKDYSASRETLQLLLEKYSDTKYKGTALYWIGETLVREGKQDQAEDILINSIAESRNNKLNDYTVYALGTVYELNKDYDNAVKYYDEILTKYYDSKIAPYAQLRIGICFFQMKEFDRAILELSDPKIKSLPLELQTESQLILANSFFSVKEFENAETSYENILSSLTDESKTSTQVKYSLAWVNFQIKDYTEAFNIFTEIADKNEGELSVKSYYWSAECKKFNKEFEKAANLFEGFVKKYPVNDLTGRANLNLAGIFYNNGDIKKSEKYLSAALGTNDKTTEARSNILLGEINIEQQNYSKSKEYFEKVFEIKPEENIINQARLGYAIANFYTDNYDTSINYLLELKQSDNRFRKDKVNFYLAESYFASNDYQSALNYYNKVGFKNPDITRETLYGKAYAYFNLKDFANSAYYFNEFISRYSNDKNNLDARYRLADCYFGIKNYKESIRVYQTILKNYSSARNNAYVNYQFGQALFRNGELNSAIDQFDRIQHIFPNSKYSDLSQYFIGWIYFQKGNFNQAITEYTKLIDGYSKSDLVPMAIYHIGDSYYNQGYYDSAKVKYELMIEKYPNSEFVFDAVNGLQYCYIATDEIDEGVLRIENLIANGKAGDYSDKIFIKKAEMNFAVGNYQRAITNYNEFINKYSNSSLIPDAYYQLGKCYQYIEEFNSALQSFEFVYTNYFSSEMGMPSVLDAASILQNQNKFDEAINLYDLALDKVEDKDAQAELLFEKSQVLINKKEIAEAHKLLNYISTNYVGNIFSDKARLELGIIELSRENYELAESLFRDLAETRLDEVGAESQYYLGVVLFELGKIDDAISAFVRVRSIFPGYDEWYTRSLIKLGDCYIKIKDYRKAREMFRAVKKHHPDDEFGNEAKQKLKRL